MSWDDWVGSQHVAHMDEAGQALIRYAFAAGFQAGWRRRDHIQP